MQDTNEIDIEAVLAERRQIAVIWSIEDVLEVRPGLTIDQCWEVLRAVKRQHDAEYGVCWETLKCNAESLFGPAPDEDE
jgi:hypothetical protein